MKTTNTLQKTTDLKPSQNKNEMLTLSVLKLKKMKTISFVFLMFITVGLFCSCDKEQDDFSPELIGTWFFEENADGMVSSERLTFSANNTGSVDMLHVENGITAKELLKFTYSINKNEMTVFMGEETNQSTYSISNNKLTISTSEETVAYTKLPEVGGSNVNIAIL